MARRWFFWGFIILGVWVVVARFTQVEQLVETLARGQWEWVLAAALLQAGYHGLQAGLYRVAFQAVGVTSRLRDLLPVWFASIFLNVAAPTAGPVIFIDDAALRGQPAARAAAGAILVRIADFGSFSLLLILGLGYLALRHDLRLIEVLAALVLLAIIAGWAALLGLARWQQERLRRILAALQGRVNALARRLHRPLPLAEDWAERNAAQFAEAAGVLGERPARLAPTFAVALSAHLLSLASLYMLFLAFHEPVRMGTLLAGFAVGLLFWIVSITPEGIGVVEGMMTLVYTSLGVPSERALVVVIAFRGLTFWLPLLLGVFFLRRVRSFGAGSRSLRPTGRGDEPTP